MIQKSDRPNYGETRTSHGFKDKVWISLIHKTLGVLKPLKTNVYRICIEPLGCKQCLIDHKLGHL